MKHMSVTRASAGEAGLLWFLLVCASARLILYYWLEGDLFTLESPMLYQAGTLGFNYFEFGAVRRGMGGSIAYLLADDLLVATVSFHLMFAAILSAAACWLYWRMEASTATRIAYAATLLAILMRWGEDVGRTDMAVVVLFAFATIAMTRRKLVVATACVCLGVFIHESSFIFGLPLLAALVWRCGGPRAFAPSQLRWAAAVILATLVAYAAMSWLPHLDRQTMVDAVRAKLPHYKHVDWAIYFALSGFRGVEASMCQNATDPSYWTHPAGGLLAIATAFIACSWRIRREWMTVLLAALPGFVLLCIVANDVARWTMFACINIWLLQAATGTRSGTPDVRPWMAALCGMILAPAVNPRTVDSIEYPIYSGSPAFERVIRKAGGARTPSVEEALARCDPYWREVLGDALPIDP